MKMSRLLSSFLSLVALAVTTRAADSDLNPVLSFARIDLVDRRVLRDVAVRAYDSGSDRFLVIASGKALTIPANLFPIRLAEQLRKDAPSSGASVSSTPNSPSSRPGNPSRPPRTANGTDAPTVDTDMVAHRAVALDRALTFYRYEFVAGSSAMRVDSVKIDAEPTRPVPGWSGRYRTLGKAYLELFDTKGWSATRAQSAFEIITEQKPNEPPTVIDFSRKS